MRKLVVLVMSLFVVSANATAPTLRDFINEINVDFPVVAEPTQNSEVAAVKTQLGTVMSEVAKIENLESSLRALVGKVGKIADHLNGKKKQLEQR